MAYEAHRSSFIEWDYLTPDGKFKVQDGCIWVNLMYTFVNY